MDAGGAQGVSGRGPLTRASIARTLVPIALLAAGLSLPRWTLHVSPQIERVYATECFPRTQALLSVLARAVPFSLAQLLIAGAVVAVLWAAGSAIRHAFRSRGLAPLGRLLVGLLWAAVAVILSMHALWGLNYARPTLAARLSLAAPRTEIAELSRVTRELASAANRGYRDAVQAGEIDSTGGVSRWLGGWDELATKLSRAESELAPSLARVSFALPKRPPLFGWILTRFGIAGIYIPFTAEATVNSWLPDSSVPFCMAHEMAHQRGIAREDEANFVAWYACQRSGSAAASYSGAVAAYWSCLRAARRADADSARVLAELLDPGPRADAAAVRRFWTRHEGPAARLGDRVNDAYLKTNAQRDGTESYGRMVDLLLAWHQADAVRPAASGKPEPR